MHDMHIVMFFTPNFTAKSDFDFKAFLRFYVHLIPIQQIAKFANSGLMKFTTGDSQRPGHSHYFLNQRFDDYLPDSLRMWDQI